MQLLITSSQIRDPGLEIGFMGKVDFLGGRGIKDAHFPLALILFIFERSFFKLKPTTSQHTQLFFEYLIASWCLIK